MIDVSTTTTTNERVGPSGENMSQRDMESEIEREGLSFSKRMALKTNPPLGLFLEYVQGGGRGNMHVAAGMD